MNTKGLCEYYPIFAVLAGYLLVAASLGPFTNGDTVWELDATSGVLQYGLPYANGFYLIDQPPVGFYVQAAFAGVFGLSFSNGTFVTTLFGLGCVLFVYVIGMKLYDRLTGTLAAALFAFSPWHLVLSRAFLIDVQCLFFSLFSLAMAVFAIRKGSLKLFFVSGIIFAVAFNTKLYAVFALIPILALFLKEGTKKIRKATIWLAVFGLPALILSVLWYETVTGISMSSIILHNDFITQNPAGVVPSYFFATNFLATYGLGWLFIDVAILSLIFGVALRKQFRSFLFWDVICLGVIIAVVGVNTVLGATFNLKAPYQNAIKYCYQALPFFAFLAGSLGRKSLLLINWSKTNTKVKKIALLLVGTTGLGLTAGALLYNMRYVNLFSTADFLIFRVEPTVNLGYSLFKANSTVGGSSIWVMQYVGFAIALSGLVWLVRNRVKNALKHHN